MMHLASWSWIAAEAKDAFVGSGRFPLRAYSEFMPPPYVVLKPYQLERAVQPTAAEAGEEHSLAVSEYEQAQELEPGLQRIATHVLGELGRLLRREPHALSRELLRDNPAWPAALAQAVEAGGFAEEPLSIALSLALSRTQDDKGNVRWTLFGASHDGAAAPFWYSFGPDDGERFARLTAWATGRATASLAGVRVLARHHPLPQFADALKLADDEPLEQVHTLVTLEPLGALPARVQAAYLGRTLRIVPSPSSLIFFEHARHRELARALPHAMQIALLHLFPRVEGGYALRIPQSGWLEENRPPEAPPHGHRVVGQVVRTHRWQRVARDHGIGEDTTGDKLAVALFSTNPDHLGLYDKPMARNVQIWREVEREGYELLLDGPHATPAELDRAAKLIHEGGHFGYRFLYPPMRAGLRELYWHLPLVARWDGATGQAVVHSEQPLMGYVTAELAAPAARPPAKLVPRLLSRPAHGAAARLFPRDPGLPRNTTANNVRKLLEARDLLARPLPPSFARRLVHLPKHLGLAQWLDELPAMASDRPAAERLVSELHQSLGPELEPGPALTFDRTATRAREQRVWESIAYLSEGPFKAKDNADTIATNAGKTGGPAARAARLELAQRRDLDRLGDYLHQRYRELCAEHGMAGRAQVLDHVFRWQTDFDFSWSEGWKHNQSGHGHERNIVLRIPGKDRREAVVMGDHYDTAYMEDLYEAGRGGDGLRASAHGADDNHSATTALLQAADVLLPMAREGKLARDVWLVHLTGEEFPSDCLGARALCQALVERSLELRDENGGRVDVSEVRVKGAFILDMIGHNSDRDRDVFQIASGEGAASAELALRTHLANERWNRGCKEWNRAPERHGKGRAVRVSDGTALPAPFAHLALAGEVRTEWEPRSALYNTDGQIFSDVGIPVVLLMENYDINRTGYHDTHDTMKNIDLDYAAALTAIAIEAVADVACG